MIKRRSVLGKALLFILCAAAVSFAAGYAGVCMTRSLSLPFDGDAAVLTSDAPSVASFEVREGKLIITPICAGQMAVMDGEDLIAVVDCTDRGFAYDHIADRYTGDVWVHAASLFFIALTSGILFLAFRKQLRENLYDYDSPLLLALFLLAFLYFGMVLLSAGLPGSGSLETTLSALPFLLLQWTMPLLIIFTIFMLASNISLLRHEGKNWRNLLGSIIGLLLVIASVGVFFNSDASGSLAEVRFRSFLINLLSGMVFWTVCKLTAIILCGIRAAKHRPAPDKDYVLILGCQIRDDGSLTPLLRGRVDRALGFALDQKASAGKMPVLIPCGGKGDDEIMSEAQAMKRYLMEQGVPEEEILTEDRSVNTMENIRNAMAMMRPGTKAAYSTTNYHVFRAGVWASRCGLKAEGMGSGTKWYYWPNAFMREYAALIAAKWVPEAALILLFGIQSGVLAYLLH